MIPPFTLSLFHTTESERLPFLLSNTLSSPQYSPMSAFVFALLILAVTGTSSATWCICKDGVGDAMLQKTLDYACGAGADCNPIHSNGPCFNPNTVRAHCNYAVNSYFQRKGQAVGSCDFAGTAIVSPSDPSFAGCAFPSSVSAAGTTTNTTPSTMIPGTTTTTPVGVLGGAGTGLGPSGIGINTDYSDGGLRLHGFISFATLLLPSLIITFCG
ncbi:PLASMODESMATA CALLOSE-BINDING PROTEIN 3-like isoform X2 [Hibiscus syriacus]|uniref:PLASMODESMATA CALLOSE-BINDING PROTEIN 3-like isoform X2 n=1 Tax=Hibiscus syriacus TaxID=106335 RepID=UPI0019218AD9|nr:PLASMODESMATA CALLOSE-BINDING PROTEIN 3-like isoform X2 [Hibiscus syriacus]